MGPYGIQIFIMVLVLLVMVFGIAIPAAFTAPVPELTQYVIENLDTWDTNLPDQFYVASYEIKENGTLRLCGYWDPPDHLFWDTGYDWVPNVVELPVGTYGIDKYPREYCPEPGK